MSKGSNRRPTVVQEEENSLRWELVSSSTTPERRQEILKILRGETRMNTSTLSQTRENKKDSDLSWCNGNTSAFEADTVGSTPTGSSNWNQK